MAEAREAVSIENHHSWRYIPNSGDTLRYEDYEQRIDCTFHLAMSPFIRPVS